MNKVETHDGYDFYTGNDETRKAMYNIVPEGSYPPAEGYYNKNVIEKIKHVKFSEKYFNLWARNTDTGKLTLLTEYPDTIQNIENIKDKLSMRKNRTFIIEAV